MNVHVPASVRRSAVLLAAALLPLAAFAATAPAAAASQPTGPTIGADIASKCNEMSGAERSACERDMRAAAKTRRSHAHATPHTTAASAPH
jgi:hypothetical protein